MELRKYRPEDRLSLAHLSAASFGNNPADWEEYYDPEKNPRLDPDQVYVIEEDGEPRASVTVLPLRVSVDGSPVPMGGVAAVSTHPAYRRRGYAGELMRLALRQMRERDVPLSMLTPFSHAFYRFFGFELALESIEYDLKSTNLATHPEQKNVRAYHDEDLPQMIALFEGEASRHPCCILRSEAYWQEIISRNDIEAAVYESGGRIEGYLLYRQTAYREDRTPHRTLKVREFVWSNPQARAGLLSFLAAHDPAVFGIKYRTSPGEPLHPYLGNSYVEMKVFPEQMLRLVDVLESLRRLKRSVEPPLVLKVQDDALPENSGDYTVSEGEVIRGARSEEFVELKVQHLAQLYAGYLFPENLARRGLITASSTRALDLAQKVFPAGDPWVFDSDFF